MRLSIKSQEFRRLALFILLLGILLLLFFFLLIKFFIVALVNGEPIWRLDIDNQLEQTYGGPVVNDRIGSILVAQEATKKHISVSQKELGERVSQVEKFFSYQGQTIDSIAQVVGQTRRQFVEGMEKQMVDEKLFGKSVTVADGEVEQFIASFKDHISSTIPQDEIYKTAKQQLFDQKVNKIKQKEIQRLQKQANIRYFIKFPS